MDKKLFLVIVLMSFLSISSLAIDPCENMVSCNNQDNLPYCVPTDISCEYTQYVYFGGNCIIDNGFVDLDNDNDGWTDNCDAFYNDGTEWMDIDGDGIGYNKDCDDFDPENTEICNGVTTTTTSMTTISDTTTTSTSTVPSSTTTSTTSIPGTTTTTLPSESIGTGGGRGKKFCTAEWDCSEWSDCEDGIKTRVCIKTNTCEDESNRPEEIDYCAPIRYLTLKPKELGKVDGTNGQDTEIDEVIVPVVFDEEDKEGGLSGITGMLSFIGGKISPWLLLLLLIILIAYLFLKKKKN